MNSGISLGMAVAAIISYSINHSIFWAILHACCSWWYVLYVWLF